MGQTACFGGLWFGKPFTAQSMVSGPWDVTQRGTTSGCQERPPPPPFAQSSRSRRVLPCHLSRARLQPSKIIVTIGHSTVAAAYDGCSGGQKPRNVWLGDAVAGHHADNHDECCHRWCVGENSSFGGEENYSLCGDGRRWPRILPLMN
jgi:hypothetical protein